MLEVSTLNETDKTDQLMGITTAMPVMTTEYNSGGFYFAGMVEGKYHSGRFGDLSLFANYPVKITEWDELSIEKEPITDSVNKWQLKGIISYPFVTFRHKKDEVKIPFGSFDDVSYIGIIPSHYLYSLNFRFGASKDYSRNLTLAHNNKLIAEHEYLSLFTKDKAVVQQSMYSLKIGASFQSFINVFLEGTGDGKNFTGKLSNLNSFYFDVNVLLNSKMDGVYTKYIVRDENNYIVEDFDGVYDLRQDLQLQRLGYTLGFESSGLGGKKHRYFSTLGIEIGFRNGYWENLSKSFYLMYSMKIGIGKGIF